MCDHEFATVCVENSTYSTMLTHKCIKCGKKSYEWVDYTNLIVEKAE